MFKEKRVLVFLLAIMLIGEGWTTEIDKAIKGLENRETRREATIALERMGASAVPSLIKKAEDREAGEETRIATILTLGKIKNKKARGALERMLTKDENEFIRQASAIGLGNLGDKGAIPKLKRALNDPSGSVRMRSAWALARLGDHSGYNLALETIRARDVTAQLLAIDALDAIGDKKAIPILEEKIKDPSSTVWTQIFSKVAIKRLEIQGLSPKDRLVFLKESLLDKNYEVVRWSAEELKGIVIENQPQRNDVVNILKECLKEYPEPQSYTALKLILELIKEGRIDPSELKELLEQ